MPVNIMFGSNKQQSSPMKMLIIGVIIGLIIGYVQWQTDRNLLSAVQPVIDALPVGGGE